ncbi:MAG: SMI1/KNR4 family protein [Pseudobacter sp.]|uniref:SMI1/KNR4 family protein n=1 Tax=Pseudobacter sp. TaxID=2045420 RepID=UPI003F80A1F2
MTETELSEYEFACPSQRLPENVKELLRFARGFQLSEYEEFDFTGIGRFGLEDIFPHSIELAGDGAGNFWIIDVKSNGDWGPVYYAEHELPVIVKQADSLQVMLEQLYQDCKNRNKDSFYYVVEDNIDEVNEAPGRGLMNMDEARQSGDPVLLAISNQYGDNFAIADLRNKPNGAGFNCGVYGKGDRDYEAIRYKEEPIWIFEKKKNKGFLSRLFGG